MERGYEPFPDEHTPLTSVDESITRLSTRRKRQVNIVLPVVMFLSLFSYIVAVIELHPFLYDKIARTYDFKFNSSAQDPCGNSSKIENKTAKKIQVEIQRKVSTLELYLSITNYLIAAIPVLILGPLSDRYGRKLAFLFPLCGIFLKQWAYMLVMAWGCNIAFLFVGNLCGALGGSFAALLMAMNSVISDVTEPGKARSFRIAAMDAEQTIAASIGQLVVAKWMKSGYVNPLVFGLVLSFWAIVLVVFLLPDTARRSTARQREHTVSFLKRAWNSFNEFCLQTIKRSFMLYVRESTTWDGPPRLLKRRLCFAAFVLTAAVNFSRPTVQNLFVMKEPICWGATKEYMFGGISMLCNWVVILVILWVLQKLLGMKDRQVVIIGMVSSILAYVFLSLASNDIMVYETAALGTMIRVIIPMLRSIVSSLVDPLEQGAVYAGMACIETIGASLFSTAANRIYYVLIDVWAGSIFVIFAGIMLVALILVIILNIIFKRESSQQQDLNINARNHRNTDRVL